MAAASCIHGGGMLMMQGSFPPSVQYSSQPQHWWKGRVGKAYQLLYHNFLALCWPQSLKVFRCKVVNGQRGGGGEDKCTSGQEEWCGDGQSQVVKAI